MSEEISSVPLAKSEQTNIDQNREIHVRNGKCYRFVKRSFDIFASFIFLLLLWWLIILLAFIKWVEDFGGKSWKLVIKESPKGRYVSKLDGKRYKIYCKKDPNGEKDKTMYGAFYSSRRVSKNGEIHRFHKIRSMCPGAEKMKAELIARGFNEADEPAFKMKHDPRITKVGKFLRATSMDELPQIWDIFLGRLSIVGPRPPLPEEVANYTEYQKHRLDVKGGLLCFWQITKNRNDLSFDEWVELDIKYIETRSVWVDLKIIFKAIWFVLTDRTGE